MAALQPTQTYLPLRHRIYVHELLEISASSPSYTHKTPKLRLIEQTCDWILAPQRWVIPVVTEARKSHTNYMDKPCVKKQRATPHTQPSRPLPDAQLTFKTTTGEDNRYGALYKKKFKLISIKYVNTQAIQK